MIEVHRHPLASIYILERETEIDRNRQRQRWTEIERQR